MTPSRHGRPAVSAMTSPNNDAVGQLGQPAPQGPRGLVASWGSSSTSPGPGVGGVRAGRRHHGSGERLDDHGVGDRTAPPGHHPHGSPPPRRRPGRSRPGPGPSALDTTLLDTTRTSPSRSARSEAGQARRRAARPGRRPGGPRGCRRPARCRARPGRPAGRHRQAGAAERSPRARSSAAPAISAAAAMSCISSGRAWTTSRSSTLPGAGWSPESTSQPSRKSA